MSGGTSCPPSRPRHPPRPCRPRAPAPPPAPATTTRPRRALLGFVGTRRTVEVVLTVILGVGGALPLVRRPVRPRHGPRSARRPSHHLPRQGRPALSPAEFPGLQQYAGQRVDTGPKAKAYADEFIDAHLAGVAKGKTYSQISAESQANPTDAALTAQAATLFKGETPRGPSYAWGGRS